MIVVVVVVVVLMTMTMMTMKMMKIIIILIRRRNVVIKEESFFYLIQFICYSSWSMYLCYITYKLSDTGIICIVSSNKTSFYGDASYPLQLIDTILMWTHRWSSTHPWQININTVATRVRLILFITPASIVHSEFVVPRPVNPAVDSFLSSPSNYFRLCRLVQRSISKLNTIHCFTFRNKNVNHKHTHRVAKTHHVWSVINLKLVK